MRSLNRNERLLAGALGAVVFLVLNLAGMRWVADQMRTQRASIAQLDASVQTARQLLTQKPFWTARQDWVAQHPPEAYDDKSTRARFFQEVQTGLKVKGLKVDSKQPLDTERAGNLAIANIDLVLNGRLEAIVRWLQAVQQPGQYVTLGNFTLKQAEDGNSMQLQVRLGKVYRAGGPAVSP